MAAGSRGLLRSRGEGEARVEGVELCFDLVCVRAGTHLAEEGDMSPSGSISIPSRSQTWDLPMASASLFKTGPRGLSVSPRRYLLMLS